jgi:mono/diheme cytochrome c family protein
MTDNVFQALEKEYVSFSKAWKNHRFAFPMLGKLLTLAVLVAPLARAEALDFPATMLSARAKVLALKNASPAPVLRDAVKAHYPDQLATFEACAGVPWLEWATSTNEATERKAVQRLAQKYLPTAMVQLQEPLPQFAALYEQARAAQVGKLPRIAFVRRRSYGLRGTNATMFAHRTDRGSALMVFDPSRPDQPPQVVFETQDGFIWDLCPSWDGKKLLMSYKETNDQPFHVWEINTDGTGLRQVTRGPYHDFNPVYYPDGRIVFCSSRVESYSLCQDFLAAALHICDADGGNLRRIDFTTLCTCTPAVMPDGTILCSRWEYNDKNIFSWQGLWTVHPDGRNLKLFYGNTLTIPNSRYGGRPVPGTDQVLITMAGHHLPPISDIALVDRSAGLEELTGIRKVTFETPLQPTKGRTWRDTNWGPGDYFYSQSVTDPWPLADGLFLVAIGNDARPAAGFRICLCRYDGARFPVWAQEGESFFAPVALAPRELPRAVFGGQCPTEAGEGTFFVQDVYQGLREQGVPRGAVKTLRVLRQTPKKWNTEGPRFHDHYPIIGYGSYYVKEILGEVPVDADGSAYFTAPSNCELYFIALDERGKEIQRMGSVTQVTTGEKVSCVGCHEDRLKAPPLSTKSAARLARAPDAITPPAWGAGPVDYVKQVQPVWDRNCVSCHSGRAPKADLDLSDDKTRFFNMSFDHLMARGMVNYYFINPGPTGVFPAMGSGSWISKLTTLIETNHHAVKLTDTERRSVFAWIDANAPYYGTWDMSRPHTQGGRDPWHFVPGNQRVPPQPEPWFVEFGRVFAAKCSSCHGEFGTVARRARHGLYPHNRWLNLTRPEFSRALNAHLSREAGGLGLTAPDEGRQPPLFRDTNDPVYQALLHAIEKGKDALDARPRMDMPGGVAIPQERNFGKVF